MNSKNDYEVYRMTSLGVALEETLDDMIQVYFLVTNFTVSFLKVYPW